MVEPTFSERMGLRKPKTQQLDEVDEELRVSLWNAVFAYRTSLSRQPGQNPYYFEKFLVEEVWAKLLKLPLDQIPQASTGSQSIRLFWDIIRQWYFDKQRQWHELYDFIEFLGGYTLNEETFTRFVDEVNRGLETENSGYRFVRGRIAPITNAIEVQAVRDAIRPMKAALSPVSAHIEKALEHLSDKTAPDYRNSMKESISAVEAVCKLIAGTPDVTLKPALNRTVSELNINRTLQEGIQKIYGYTSDADGIRHSLKDMKHPAQEDARFLLIACSAFVNYVIELPRKQGKLPIV
jgi:hypothetical protein